MRLRNLIRPVERLRYLLWRASRTQSPITVELVTGERLILRPPPAGDLSVAYEIFVAELYRSPRVIEPASVRTIVDVGANVGYSATYFARRYPSATIVVFEPHPVHVEQIRRQVRLNRIDQRLRLLPVAAGIAEGPAFLLDQQEASRVVATAGPDRLAITVADFFSAVGPGPIDLLKLDCEGSEYPLLMDDRFGALTIHTLVLEWHAVIVRPDVDGELKRRLTSLGYAVESGPEHDREGRRFGMMWAYRSP